MAGGSVVVREMIMRLVGVNQMGPTIASAESGAARVKTAMAGAGAAAETASTQFSGLGFAAAAGVGMTLRAVAQFQQQTTLASLAAGGLGVSLKSVTQTSLDLSRALGQSPVAMATLIRQIDQMGDPARKFNAELGSAAVRLSALTGGDLSSDDASQGIYRLLQATTHSQAAFETALQSAQRYASAIYAAGHMSSAGVPGTMKMIQQLESLGTMANFSTSQIISLSAALGNLGESRGGQMATALQKLFGNQFPNPSEKGVLANFLGMTPQEFESDRVQKPMELLLKLMQTLDKAAKSGKYGDTASVMRILGLSSTSDVRVMAGLIQSLNIGSLGPIQDTVSGQLSGDNLALLKDHATLMQTLAGQWGQFTSSLAAAAIVIGQQLVPVLGPLLMALKGIADAISQNPWLARMVAFSLAGRAISGTATLLGGGIRNGMRALLPLAGGLGYSGPGGGTSRVLSRLMWFRSGGAAKAAGLASGASVAGASSDVAGLGSYGMMLMPGGARSRIPFVGNVAARVAAGAANGMAEGGLLSRIGGGLIGGIGGLFGRTGAGMAAGEGLASMTGVGAIAAAVGLLQPVFQNITNFLQELGKQGGIMGAVAKVAALLTAALSGLGRVINNLFGWLGDMLGGVGNFLHGIGEVTGINALFGAVGGGIDDFTSWMNGGGGGGGGGPAITVNNYNISTQTQDATLDRMRQLQATQSLSGKSNVAYARP